MSDYDDTLLRHAKIYIKSGELKTARQYLERALISADDHETRCETYFWLSEISEDPVEKRKFLEEVLAIDNTHARARRSLAIIDGKLRPDEIINPDALPAPVAGTEKASARRFTCSKCGGRMVFDGDGRTLVCEQCHTRQSPSGQVLEDEKDFFVAMASGEGHRKPVSTQIFQCKGCGAEFVLPPEVISATCAYCGSAHIVNLTREVVQPDVIIPMAFNQHGAAVRLVRWVEKHEIKPQGKVQAPRGIYMPVWTFDILGNIPWNGVIYRNKQYVPVSGIYALDMDDFSVPASRKMPEMFAKVLPEYDYKEAPVYDPRYLAGWPAEIYEIAMSDASLKAREQAVQYVRSDIQTRNANVQNLNYNTTSIAITSFKLALVPFWLTKYMMDDQRYQVIINGQNGAVHGQTPKKGIMDWIENLFGE
jgi:DNA-directed RNA polymerase subunit RPC12/RpoP